MSFGTMSFHATSHKQLNLATAAFSQNFTVPLLHLSSFQPAFALLVSQIFVYITANGQRDRCKQVSNYPISPLFSCQPGPTIWQ